MPSALYAATDFLVFLFKGSPELALVTVEDSSAVTNAAWELGIIIGDDGDPDSETISTFTQTWLDMAHTRREETGEIPCVAIAQSGSTDIRAQRARVSAMAAECERLLIANPTLGGAVTTLEVTTGSMSAMQTSRGSAVIVPFIVSYWAIV